MREAILRVSRLYEQVTASFGVEFKVVRRCLHLLWAAQLVSSYGILPSQWGEAK